MVFLCVDIGGTNTLLGIGNDEFEVVEKMKTQEFLKDVRKIIEENLEDTQHSLEDIEKTAIAAAGPIDREEKVFYPPNFDDPGLEEVDLGTVFEELGEIYILNDATSAVIGEYYYGEHHTENLVYVTISSGIGAGVILNGEVIEAAEGNFAEIGHMKISENNLKCGCGGRDHWEAFSSGENLSKMAKSLFDVQYEDAIEIFNKFDQNDPMAERVISKMQEINNIGMQNIVNFFNPEKIILGGSLPLNHPEVILNPIKNNLENETVNMVPEVDVCSLGEHSVIHGLRATCNGLYKPSK